MECIQVDVNRTLIMADMLSRVLVLFKKIILDFYYSLKFFKLNLFKTYFMNFCT